MFVISGLLIALVCFWVDAHAIGGVALIAGVLVQSLPRRYVIGVGEKPTTGRARARRQARKDADYMVRELAGELTAAERKAIREEEDAVYNARARGGWTDSYIDADGYKRNSVTGEREYMNRNDKGNGRRA